MDSLFFRNGDVRIHVRDLGGEGDPLVLSHSTGFGWWMWLAAAPTFRQRFHVYAFDQRGHGDSDKPDDGYDFETFAQDLQAALDGLGIDQAVAVGHSAGAAVLVVHAALFPGRLRRLALIEPVLNLPPDASRQQRLAENARRRRALFASPDEMHERFRERPPFSAWEEEALRAYCEEGTRQTDAGRALKCPPELEARVYEAIARFDPTPYLQRIAVTACFFWARAGIRAASSGPGPESLVTAAETRVLAGGHFLPMETPAVAREALEFLA